MRPAVDAIAALAAPFVFGVENEELEEVLLRELVASGLHVAVAESCTGGMVLERLTRVPGASGALLGGVVAYDNRIKVEQLGVEPRTLDEHGAVSGEVALEMASGVADRTGAELGIAVTGVAGPSGGTEAKPVGTVWIAATLRGEGTVRGEWFGGDRESVRGRSAQAALALAVEVVRRGGLA
jgi:nicotinamide-nucleotide amidase